MVQEEIGLGSGGIEEVDSDDDPEVVLPPLKEVMKMSHILEENSMVVCTEGAFSFVKALCEYQGHLQKMSREGHRQCSIPSLVCSCHETIGCL